MPKDTQGSSNQALGFFVVIVLVVLIGFAAYALARQFKMTSSPNTNAPEEVGEYTNAPESSEKTEAPTATSTQEQIAPASPETVSTTGASLATDPISFADSGADIRVTRESVSFPFASQQLAARAQACGIDKPAAYWDTLTGKYADVQAMKFTFSDIKPHEGGDYFVTVVPNKTDVKSLTEFKQIFNQCAPANLNLYPFAVNANSLVFVSKCEPTAKLPNGCVVAREKVQPTLSVK